MPFYYAANDSDEICVTRIPFIKLLLDSAMRKASKAKGPTKKAATFSEENIKSLLRTIFWPQDSENFPSTSLKNWRTAVRLYTYYMTLCRYDCYSKLTLSSIEFHDDHLVIKYPSRKNDQLYTGSTSILKYRPNNLLCPRLIFQTYISIMKFANPGDILNCRLTRNGKEARPNTKLSYLQSRFQELAQAIRHWRSEREKLQSFRRDSASRQENSNHRCTDLWWLEVGADTHVLP